MEISVILCAYNAESSLRRAIDSILSQSMGDFELLVVDDGSTDATPNIIKNYVQSDPRVRYLSSSDENGRNAGPSKARNTGLDASAGDYLYFADADDWLEPDMLERLLESARRHDSQIVCCGYVMETDGTARQFLYREFHAAGAPEIAAHLPALQSGQLLNVLWNKLFRRDLIEKASARFPDHMRSGQDRWFNCRLAMETDSYTFVNLPLYHYIVHRGGITYSLFDPDRFKWACEIFVMQKALFDKYSLLDEQNLAALSFMFTKVVLACFTQLYYDSCPWDAVRKKAYVSGILSDPTVKDALRAAQPSKTAQKSVLAGLRTGSPFICLAIARLTAFSSRYLQPLLIRIKY